jgi:vacuolar-type H+-ATPase subunit F/Vma7
MRGDVAVVCTPAAASGFRLAGLTPFAGAPEEAAQHVARCLAAPAGQRPAVLLIEETLLAALPPSLGRRLARDPALLAVPFPAPRTGEATAPDAFLLEILRQAIGYRVRLA